MDTQFLTVLVSDPGSIMVITRMWQEVDTSLLNEWPPQQESSSFPFFASLPVNVVRGILTAITAAGLGMSHVEDKYMYSPAHD